MAKRRATSKAKRSIRQLQSHVFEQVLEAELDELTRVKRWCHAALKIAVMVWQDFFDNLVKLQAMALAFKTLLSLAPLLAVLFSILKAFGVHNRMEPAMAEALAPLGDKGREITAYLIGFVDKMSAGALGAVGLVTLFLTVLSLMHSIEEAFNRIWRVRASRTVARKFSDYLSAILVGPVLVFAAVTITATLQSSNVVRALLSSDALGKGILTLLRLVPYLTLWGAFTFVYVFIPNTRVRIRSAVVGGLIAAILWQTVGWGFAKFVAVVDAVLRDLFELRDFAALPHLAAHRLGDCLARCPGGLRAPAYLFFPRRSPVVGAEPGGAREAGAADPSLRWA